MLSHISAINEIYILFFKRRNLRSELNIGASLSFKMILLRMLYLLINKDTKYLLNIHTHVVFFVFNIGHTTYVGIDSLL